MKRLLTTDSGNQIQRMSRQVILYSVDATKSLRSTPERMVSLMKTEAKNKACFRGASEAEIEQHSRLTMLWTRTSLLLRPSFLPIRKTQRKVRYNSIMEATACFDTV